MQTIHERFAGVLHSVKNNSISSKKKKTIIYLLVSLLVLSIGIGVIAGVTSRKKTDAVKLPPAAHAVLKSSCTSTLYPDLCYSSVADSVSGAAENLSSKKSVIGVALNATCTAVEHNYVSIKKLSSRKNLTKREKQAVHDCLEMVDETLDELHTTIEDLRKYPSNKSLSDHADDMRTLMSSAITNQETCLDGFSHDSADREVRAALEAGQTLVTRMCSNALAMIKNMTDEDLEKERVTAAEKKTSRKVLESGGQSWPEWISAGDRRLLQSSSVKADLVVAADGSGDYKTVAEAVAKAPEKSSKRFVIQIKSGVYRENVEVTKKKTNIMFVGDGRMKTIITGDKNVVDGTTTFKSATVAIVGGGFLARDITFQNTAGPSKHQAVALRVGADLSAFYRCDFLAYQDTLYVHSNRQFFMNCLIVGTVDFIFGNAAAVFQDCDIHARRPNSGQKNMVTAQSRADPNQNTGIVIQSSRIGATSDLQPVKASFPTYLGRPWKEYSRTVIMKTEIGDVIQAAGWHDWSGDFALATLYYGEYQNTGAGADTSKRVNWKGFKVITSAAEAEQFSAGKFIAGGNWLASSGFPFSLGL